MICVVADDSLEKRMPTAAADLTRLTRNQAAYEAIVRWAALFG